MMDYQSRISQSFRPTPSHQNPHSILQRSTSQTHTQRAPRQEDPNAFMLLSDAELLAAFRDLTHEGLPPFTASDLQKPTPQHIFQIYEWFANALMAVMPETVDPASAAATVDVYGENADLVPQETRNMVAFYASLRRMMAVCAISDFSLTDLLRPEKERVVKHFSYLINFWRFRAEKLPTWESELTKAEEVRDKHDGLYNGNLQLEHRIGELRQQSSVLETSTAEKVERNEALKTRLLELRRQQEKATERWEQVRAEKARLAGLLEQKTAAALASRQEAAKLRPYAEARGATLRGQLDDLSRSLGEDKALIDSLERRSRALGGSAEAFSLAKGDVDGCVKVLEDISASLGREEEEGAKASRQRDALAERSANLDEVSRTEQLLSRQLSKWNERTEKLRTTSREKADCAKERMVELQEVHRQLTEERGEKGRDMEKRRIRIEQTEKKMADLREAVEKEVGTAREQFIELDAHIRLYILEMEQSLEIGATMA